MEFLLDGITNVTWQQAVMWVVGALLIYLAISKELEPTLLLPMGFGAILVNLPLSGALNQTLSGIGEVTGILDWLFKVGIEASEAMPLLLFIGIGAMIDFGPLLSALQSETTALRRGSAVWDFRNHTRIRSAGF